jgi:ATP-dependent DNA helicase RecG
MTAPKTMNLTELVRFLAESQGEWEHIEFRKSTGELHGGLEALCAFLNGLGGNVLFGVSKAGRIGSKIRHARTRRSTEVNAFFKILVRVPSV